MKEILWFRRDLRLEDNAVLAHAKKDVLPIFIFDTDILSKLPKDDKRVTFIYQSVLQFKQQLQSIHLDLAIFYGKPKEVFEKLKQDGFTKVLCSIDFDAYAKKRDDEVNAIIPLQRYLDSFILDPNEHLKKDKTPYKVFTPFYKSVQTIWESSCIETYPINNELKKVDFAYENIPSLTQLGFEEQILPSFLNNSVLDMLEKFQEKIHNYEEHRDYFHENATSNLSVFLRFGLISPKQVFNFVRQLKPSAGVECFIKELFWREFYNYILFHFPKSEFENFNGVCLPWKNSDEVFQKWTQAKTGIPLIDAAMIHLNQTGMMHNRLRMIVASFATKNLLIPWKRCEEYFALKLLDYEASSNVGSWQWAASTGADSVPYFRVFNPYLQSKKFDKKGIFIKSVLAQLKEVDAKLLHQENGLVNETLVDYPKPIVSIEGSRKRAIAFYRDVTKL